MVTFCSFTCIEKNLSRGLLNLLSLNVILNIDYILISLAKILNDHHLEQLVHFPTRERNTLDLIITSLPSQFVDIQSPDRLSDHDIVSGTLK